MWSLGNALRICVPSKIVTCFALNRNLLHTKHLSPCSTDLVSLIRECCFPINGSQTNNSNANLKPKANMSKLFRHYTLTPDHVILMWASSPKSAKKFAFAGNSGDNIQSLSISLSYDLPDCALPMDLVVFRPMNEPFSQTCEKLIHKIWQFALKHEHLTFDDVDATSNLKFHAPSRPSLLLQTNEHIFLDEGMTEIFIGDKKYSIVRNPVRCLKLHLKMRPLVGCPMMASYDLADGEKANGVVNFHWFVADKSTPLVRPKKISQNTGDAKCGYELDGWMYRHSGKIYHPSAIDVGKQICVLMECGTHAPVYCTMSDDVVMDVIETFIFDERQAQCREPTKHSTRLLSYNILADLYLNLKESQEKLYFPYCPKEYQMYSYRYPILLKEITGYNADLIFLQEVDERLWIRFLPTVMGLHGFHCSYKRKGLKVNEGLVICFRHDKFKLIDKHDVWLTDLLEVEHYPENQNIADFFNQNQEIKELFISRPTVLQVITVTDTRGAIIILANTHLHFDPRHEIIKLLQSLICGRFIQRITAEYERKYHSMPVRVIFAGDFNSLPNSAVYELLSSGVVSSYHFGETYQQQLSELGNVHGVDGNSHSKLLQMQLTSLANDESTNHTRHYRYDSELCGFEGCLDYIWGSKDIKVAEVIPMPKKERIKQYVALPSKICPSDHLPIICDIRYDE